MSEVIDPETLKEFLKIAENLNDFSQVEHYIDYLLDQYEEKGNRDYWLINRK
jgi:hypothetical protein